MSATSAFSLFRRLAAAVIALVALGALLALPILITSLFGAWWLGALFSGFFVFAILASLFDRWRVTRYGWDITQPPWQKSRKDESRQVKSFTAEDGAPIQIAVDGCTSQAICPGKWTVSLYFTIFNRASADARLFDLHIHSFLEFAKEVVPGELPRLTIEERKWIELDHHNSALAGGKAYVMKSGDLLHLATQVDVSRLVGDPRQPQSGRVLCLFTLFADCYLLDALGARKVRVPCDSVFCFQDDEDKSDGYVAYVNERNLEYYEQKHAQSAGGSALVKTIARALKSSTSEPVDLP